MIRYRSGNFFALFFTFLALSTASELSTTILQVPDGGTANISLSTYNKTQNVDQAFTQLININDSANFAITVNDIPTEVSFVIIQLHAYMHNASMSYNKTSIKRTPGNFVIGTNIGLYVDTTGVADTVVYASNENNFEIAGLVAVVAYRYDAPSPGGCNMEFDIKRSPFQKLFYNHATVTVDAQPAAVPNIGNFELPCEKYPLQHDAYRMYLPEEDFSNETYFSAIANMLTVRDIERNADFIPASIYGSPMRRVFSVYPGTGSIHGMVARFGSQSAAYVPIVTYGCDSSSWSNSCSMLTTTFSKVLCALTFFIGLFVTMRGQYYFKTSMFLMGLLFGGFIGYILGNFIGTFDITGVLVSALVIGTMSSLLWFVLWSCLSSPIPSLMLSGLTLGTFFFCLFYFTIPVGLLYLEVNAYFCLIFASFLIVSILIFSLIPLAGNIICFTTLGAYATILSIDYYCGASFKYILLNAIRRATVSNFNVAIIQPPYQDKDVLLTVFWSFLVILGLYKQCATNWNRAPFPPSSPILVRDTENAPLLGGQRYRSRYRSFNNPRFRYENSSELRF
ncbi:transmembrane 7 superfamily member 3 [Nasonia vitripennis]|uniref:TM7S3/TM198-like domain-containing protein n=1 Tax=Nasonia vitripennis TaxID=7425 RepID=A0A7M7G3S1_NASVI|nr:transmembrane 7 superfamily member 3 [Nasonia vitripennis]